MDHPAVTVVALTAALAFGCSGGRSTPRDTEADAAPPSGDTGLPVFDALQGPPDADPDVGLPDAAPDFDPMPDAASAAPTGPPVWLGLCAGCGVLRSARHTLFGAVAPVEAVGAPAASGRHRLEPGFTSVLSEGE